MARSAMEPVLMATSEGLATITLNRPDSYNALDLALGQQLLGALIACDESSDVRAVLITGNGPAFCSGGDIREMQAHADDGGGAGEYLKRLTVRLHAIVATIARMPKPVVTAVNGPAAGAGLSLALAGDLVLASERATFTVAYTAIGLAPDGGSSYLLPRLIGPKRAFELIATNRAVEPAEALELGMVNRVHPADGFLEGASDYAASLARGATVALGHGKNLLLSGATNGLETVMEYERRAIASCGSTADFREGATAFMEKREPRFVGS